MNIALIAHDKKKELMVQFCIAYKGIFKKHNLIATDATGSFVSDATGLVIEKMLPGSGGVQQIGARIAYNEIDCVLFFRDPFGYSEYDSEIHEIMRLCDVHNIPLATNIASAEIIIMGINRGDLDWRNYLRP
ncbi:MAG: methylglyoxal synthase [Clostridia bacterium]|nr:methylglyoxal synthase [Clostridia bacterium]